MLLPTPEKPSVDYRGIQWVLTEACDHDGFAITMYARCTDSMVRRYGYAASSPARTYTPRRVWDAIQTAVAHQLFEEPCRIAQRGYSAVDYAPWEIHRIRDNDAHRAALEAYLANRV